MGNVPKLRFKEFKGEWQEKTLAQLATFYNSKRVPLTESDRVKGPYPYYGASGIIDYVEDYLFDGTYILLGEDGANIVLRNSRLVFLAHGKFWVNNHAHIFQAKESNEFLCEALERLNYTKYNTGTAQPKLNSDVVKKVRVPTPSRDEQQKIAAFLTAVDTKIEQLTQKEALLKQYKKGVMQKIFSQEIRFKADDGSEYPEWATNKLSSFMDERRTQAPKSDAYPLMAFIAYKGVAEKGDRYNREFLVNDEGGKKYKQTEYGDFIYSSNNLEVGSIGLNTYGNASISPVYSIFKIKEKFNEKFISNYLVRPEFLSKMIRYRQGVVYGQWRIHEKDFLKIEERIPSWDEQNKIAQFFDAIENKLSQIALQLAIAKTFKKGLLQQMFV